MNETVRALTLRAAPFKENDLLLTLFTASGTRNALCRGIRRSKRAHLYAQPFVYSEFELFCGRGLAIVDGAETLEPFYALREDIERLSLAQYLGDAASFSAQGRDCTPLLKLLLNSLALLSEGRIDPTVVKTVFELKYAQTEGFAPSPGGCSVCGKPIAAWAFGEGLLCSDCAHGAAIPLSDALIRAIRHILTADGMRTYAFRMNPSALQTLSRLTEQNLQYHLDTVFPSLRYYRQFADLKEQTDLKNE